MKTAIDQFNSSVWFVLNKIKDYTISEGKLISYYFDLDITRRKPMTYRDEERALQYLQKNKVIKEIVKVDTAEIGLPAEENHKIYSIYHFKINNKFSEYYDIFTMKVSANIKAERHMELAKKQILEFIQAKKLGSKQSKLLRTLSGTIPVPMSVLERNTRTKNLKALVRDTRKMLEKSHFEIKLVRSSSISKENAYQLSVISQ